MMVIPAATPKMKRSVFIKPNLVAYAMDIILFGPGVNEETKTKSKNGIHCM